MCWGAVSAGGAMPPALAPLSRLKTPNDAVARFWGTGFCQLPRWTKPAGHWPASLKIEPTEPQLPSLIDEAGLIASAASCVPGLHGSRHASGIVRPRDEGPKQHTRWWGGETMELTYVD